MKYIVLAKHVLTYVKINSPISLKSILIINYMTEEYLYFIIVLKMKYLSINSFCHSRYEGTDAFL